MKTWRPRPPEWIIGRIEALCVMTEKMNLDQVVKRRIADNAIKIPDSWQGAPNGKPLDKVLNAFMSVMKDAN